MASKDDLMNIFDLSVEDVDTHKNDKKESVIYNPSADKGKDGVYRALIRFIPNPVNKHKSILKKYVYWLTDQEGQSAYYDAPSTVGEKDPVQDAFFKLRKSESAMDQKKAEMFKRKEVYYSLVYIVKDPHNQELEGKIKIFKYGYKIKEKIDEELTPQFDEPTQIFDLFKGKNFELTITKQGGFNNYSASKFQGKKSALLLNGKEVTQDANDRDAIMNLLKDAPKLEEFDFKPWTDEIKAKIDSIVNGNRSIGKSIDTIVNDVKKESIEDTFSSTKDVVDEEEDDLQKFLADLEK